MNTQEIDTFTSIIWDHYRTYAREMPWRLPEKNGTFDPYKILVSEMMLQQTQVDRVRSKYVEFITRFPDTNTLAKAKFEEVLRVWSGLGYNRRAKYLHDFSKNFRDSTLPDTVEELSCFKGIGINTASAVIVYSYNKPLIFIETNIRTVYLHHFFKDFVQVSDKEILEIVQATVDSNNPREWYWALMDYGSYLKKSGIKNMSQCKHYSRQSTFQGSERQLRGQVLRLLLSKGSMKLEKIQIELNDGRVLRVVMSLEKDKLVNLSNGVLSLP